MPPPPPPPGAPPPPALPKLGGGVPTSGGGGAPKDLLKDIRLGAKLKPTVTNDRSAPLVGGPKPNAGSASSSAPAATGGRAESQSSQLPGPLPGIGGLFAGGFPKLKPTNGVKTGRASSNVESPQKLMANGSSSSNKLANSSTASSLNSSPSLSPSPSPVTSTPTHAKPAPVVPTQPAVISSSASKPVVPAAKPSLSRPQNGGGVGPIHPSSKPPPPPVGNKTNLGRNQTIGHGPQGRPQIPNYEKRRSRDDSSIANGQISVGAPPPPPVRTVSQTQITPGSRQPARAPPPPPPSSTSHKRPTQPPPPPPVQAPAPPVNQGPPTKALPPTPSGMSQTGDPPTPPTRRESIYRTGQGPAAPPSSGYNSSTSSNGGESFETKFASRFKTLQFLPPPEPFSGCQKTYPSKQTLPVRQGSQIKRTPAPPPPPGNHVPPPPPPGSHAPPPPGKILDSYKSEAFGRPPLPTARQLTTTSTGLL